MFSKVNKWGIVLTIVVFAMVSLTCGIPTIVSQPSQNSSYSGGECDASAQQIEMNKDYTGQVSGGTFPENCSLYCLWVPDGGSSLIIELSNFDVDLDLYVDTDLSVLTSSSSTTTSEWGSYEFGTGDEQVTISNPGGRYYIQTCSYEGLATDFNLHAEYRP